ncbi:hypothetical protein PG997_001153 [Apiospora hydei]|uniref:EF-hand domain-containing protein n=1 Tax=Apiospora hydei TaxID=1337664 RepID=A0ABR1XD29_9PEZI
MGNVKSSEHAVELFSRIRATYANAIFEDYKMLQSIMDRHEALIRRRWKKKSHSERRVCLKTTWPYIPTKHLADLGAVKPLYALHKFNDTDLGPKEESCMWPDLNLEDLVLPEPLPLMLSARSSSHDPSHFADADFDRCAYAVSAEVICNYAPLSKLFDTECNATASVHTKGLAACRIGYPIGEAVLLLQIQARIYSFLVEVCKTVLHDKKPDELTGSHIPLVPRPLDVNIAPTPLGSLKAAAIRAPYRVPAEMDMGRMLEMVSAKVDAAEEHLHSMREDPAYFNDALQDYETHNIGWLDRQMGEHSRAEMRDRGYETISYPAARALFWPGTWSRVLLKLQKLATSLSRGEHKTDEDLPPELDANYRDVLHYVQDLEAFIAWEMRWAFVSTPRVRPFFLKWQRLKTGKGALLPQPDEDMVKVFLALDSFEKMDNLGTREVMKSHILLDDLERFRAASNNNNTTAEPWIDPYVAGMMSDMSIVAECRRQLALFQPWARHYRRTKVPKNASGREYRFHNEHLREAAHDDSDIFPGFLTKVADTVLPAAEKLQYPAEWTRDKGEGYLELLDDRGWEPSGYIKSLLDRDIERTADWLPTTPAPLTTQQHASPSTSFSPTKVLTPVPTQTPTPTPSPVGGLANLFAALTTGEEDRPRRFKPVEKKTKTKTRGLAMKENETAKEKPKEDNEGKADELPAFLTARVDSRSADVFDVLFHRTGASHAGQVKWTEFLHAMTHVGFRAEKLYGSVWQFSPSAAAAAEMKLTQSIHFHEPHPSSRIPFNRAQAMGRRLTRRYG